MDKCASSAGTLWVVTGAGLGSPPSFLYWSYNWFGRGGVENVLFTWPPVSAPLGKPFSPPHTHSLLHQRPRKDTRTRKRTCMRAREPGQPPDAADSHRGPCFAGPGPPNDAADICWVPRFAIDTHRIPHFAGPGPRQDASDIHRAPRFAGPGPLQEASNAHAAPCFAGPGPLQDASDTRWVSRFAGPGPPQDAADNHRAPCVASPGPPHDATDTCRVLHSATDTHRVP